MQHLFIPPSLVKSAQTGRLYKTIWTAVDPNGTNHRWKLNTSEPLGIDNFIDWLTVISDEFGCPLEVKHRSNNRTLASGTVQLKASKEVK